MKTKNKFNWGWGLVTGMVLFISFILFFVYRMTTETALQYDLVTEDYYKKELELQDNINASNNAALLSQQIFWETSENGLTVVFPDEMNPAQITGTLIAYRPSNKRLDFEMPLALDGNRLHIPAARLLPGRWNFTVNWNYLGKPYRLTRAIIY